MNDTRRQPNYRESLRLDDGAPSVPFVDLYAPLNFMVTLHVSMMEPSRDFTEQFDANAALLRRLAGQLAETVIVEKSLDFDDDNVMRQVQEWQQDPLLRELRSAYRRDQAIDPLSAGWIVTTSPKLQPT